MTKLLFITKKMYPLRNFLTPPIRSTFPFFHKRKKGISLALFLLVGTSQHCQGMELAWSIGSYVLSPVINVIKDQIPEETKNFVYESTIGNPKEFDEVIKEFTFNRWNTRDLLEKKILDLNKSATYLSVNEPIKGNYNFTLPKVIEHAMEAKKYAFRYSEAILALAFTHECKLLLDEKIDDLKTKLTMAKDEEEIIILDYLINMKKNLCANLYAKYSYKRNGGFRDKLKLHWKAETDRERYWGWTYHQNVNNSAIPKIVNDILEGDDHLSIKNYLQKVWNAYESTISFLKTKEIDLVDQYYNHQLNIYQEKFYPLFEKQPPSDFLTCKLIEDFDKKLKEGWTNPFNTKTLSRPIPKAREEGQEMRESYTHSPENSITTKSQNFARSTSFSEQSSSLPVSFLAAIDIHNRKDSPPSSSPILTKKENKEKSPKIIPTQSPVTPTLPNIPTQQAFKMLTVDDYNPEISLISNTMDNTKEYSDSFSESGEPYLNNDSDQSNSFSSSDENL